MCVNCLGIHVLSCFLWLMNGSIVISTILYYLYVCICFTYSCKQQSVTMNCLWLYVYKPVSVVHIMLQTEVTTQ